MPRPSKQQTLLGYFTSSPPPSPGPPKRKRARKASSSSSSHSDKRLDSDTDVGAIHFEPELVNISDEDHSPRRPKKHKSLSGAHAVPTRTSGDESLDDTVGEPCRRKGKRRVVLDSEDDTRSRTRKFIKGTRPLTPDDDDDILKAKDQVLESRLRSRRGKMTAFQKNLERLKSKKRGELVVESSSEAEQSESDASVPFKGAKPHRDSDASLSETNSEHDSFIVDDDAHGVPAAQLPLAFSLSTHQDLTHQFKIICQLFVHLAVRPLADRRPFFKRALKEEEYLAVPLQVTRRKLYGMRDSLVASSVWRSDFKKALERYPKFTLLQLKFAIPQCDACHLGGRVSTLLGRLNGKPYDRCDFEDLSDEEPDESAEEDEGADDTGAEFHLGRFCAIRTQVYHQFSHWEYTLYKSLQREILDAQDGTRQFVKVAYSGGIKPPRDLHDADRIMEWLDERGIIGMEWQKVRQMMDSARSLERGEMDDAVL